MAAKRTDGGRAGFCGIDFGTSNSTIAVKHGAGVALAPVEGEDVALPPDWPYVEPLDYVWKDPDSGPSAD